MKRDAQELLADFEALPAEDRHAVAVEIFRRFDESYGLLSDETLNSLADELFQALDAEEGPDGDTTAR